ncbi:transposase [Streptomyces sp. NPDC058683]|uniref:transposase n=1 Tax=Streptomyces sp. NPDC058683 TaxID=3346597 RepID=UPI003654B81A
MPFATWSTTAPSGGPCPPTSRRGTGRTRSSAAGVTRHGQEVPQPAARQGREREGRNAEPTAGVIDSQPVKADAVVGSDSRGFDGGKLINGRKRHVVVDTLGLLLGVTVTAADTGDRAAARVLLEQVADAHHRLELVRERLQDALVVHR